MVMETTPPAANQTGFAKITEKSGDKGQSETETVLAPLWPGVAEDVPDEVKDQLLAMLIDHKAAFCLKNWDLGFTDTLRHEMNTGITKRHFDSYYGEIPSHRRSRKANASARADRAFFLQLVYQRRYGHQDEWNASLLRGLSRRQQ